MPGGSICKLTEKEWEERQRIALSMYRKRIPIPEIAEHFGVSVQTISRTLKYQKPKRFREE
jgi:transposase